MSAPKYMMECEFIGGPVDGLVLPIDDCRGLCAFMEHSKVIETVKSCGVMEVQVPYYKRINESRFSFVGYR